MYGKYVQVLLKEDLMQYYWDWGIPHNLGTPGLMLQPDVTKSLKTL